LDKISASIISLFSPSNYLCLFFVFAAFAQLPCRAQTLNDSFGSSTSDQRLAPAPLDSSANDIFSNNTPASPPLTYEEVNQRINTFAQSLSNDPKALYGTLDQLLRKRLDNWHYPNLSRLSIWIGDCQAALHKAGDINDKIEYQNSFHNRTPQEVRHTLEEKHQIDDCWNAWLKAFNTVMTLLPHNRTEEEEPRVSESRAEALKAIELAETICHLHPPSTMQTPPLPPSSSDHLPPLAPQRPVLSPTNPSPGSSPAPKQPATTPVQKPGPTGKDIAKHAHELGERHPDMWVNEQGPHGEIRKCNLFVDRTYRDLGAPLPWGKGHTPTVHVMQQLLSHSRDWETVYRSSQSFNAYKPQAGDLAIWNKTITTPYRRGDGSIEMQHKHIEHSGIIGTEGEIVYAGSARGYAESDFQSMSHAVAWGPPTAIFRPKHWK